MKANPRCWALAPDFRSKALVTEWAPKVNLLSRALAKRVDPPVMNLRLEKPWLECWGFAIKTSSFFEVITCLFGSWDRLPNCFDRLF